MGTEAGVQVNITQKGNTTLVSRKHKVTTGCKRIYLQNKTGNNYQRKTQTMTERYSCVRKLRRTPV